jgi:hypothetical protein
MGITKYEDVRDISPRPDVWSSVGGIRPDSGPTGMMIEQDDPARSSTGSWAQTTTSTGPSMETPSSP